MARKITLMRYFANRDPQPVALLGNAGARLDVNKGILRPQNTIVRIVDRPLGSPSNKITLNSPDMIPIKCILVTLLVFVLIHLVVDIVFCVPFVNEHKSGIRHHGSHSANQPQITTREHKSILDDDDPQKGQKKNSGQPTITQDTGDSMSNRRQGKDLRAQFREDVDNYPEDEINQILKHTPNNVKELYNVANTTLDSMATTFRSANFHYYDSEPDEQPICRSRMRNIFPKEALRNNYPVYIANNQEFKQIIQAEICETPDRPCDKLQSSLPYGWESFCRQKYSFKKLLYLDADEKRLASDLFPYPSCCSCNIRFITDAYYLRSSSTNGTSALNTLTTLNNSSIIEDESDSTESDRHSTRKLDLRSQRDKNKNHTTVVLHEDKIYTPHS